MGRTCCCSQAVSCWTAAASILCACLSRPADFDGWVCGERQMHNRSIVEAASSASASSASFGFRSKRTTRLTCKRDNLDVKAREFLKPLLWRLISISISIDGLAGRSIAIDRPIDFKRLRPNHAASAAPELSIAGEFRATSHRLRVVRWVSSLSLERRERNTRRPAVGPHHVACFRLTAPALD